MKFTNKDWAAFLVRLALAVIFIYAGYMKLSGMEQVIGFFGSIGLPAFVAYLVAIVEFLGGIAILTGWRTKYSAWALAVIMVGALYFVSGRGFQAMQLPLVLLLISVATALSDAGAIVLMKKKGN